MYKDFAEIVSLWGSLGEMADDIGAKQSTVSKWKQRNAIPPEWWASVIEAAERRKYVGVTADVMTQLAARQPDPAPAAE